LVLYLGYLALRRVAGHAETRAKRSAVAALIAVVDVPIVHLSVVWWRTLHQSATVLTPNLQPTVHGSMAWTMLLGFCAFTLVYAWLLVRRYRLETLEERLETEGLSVALAERRAEAAESVVVPRDRVDVVTDEPVASR
jgi:heme exporter protein C